MLPYFRRAECRAGSGEDVYRGREGSLTVTDMEWRHPLCDAFIEGAVQMGIPRNPDYNGHIQEGVSYVQRTIADGRRMSTARAFLRPAMKRGNLRVRTSAHATEHHARWQARRRRALHAGRRARRAEGGACAAARLFCAAALTTRLSSCICPASGQPSLLSSLGIPVRHDLPGVGENLGDHYAPRFVARVKNITTINEMARGVRLAGEIAKYFVARKGILSLNPTLVYVFWRSEPDVANSDLQLTFTPASYKEGVQSQLDDFPGVTVASWQQRPESKGYVRARSSDPFEPPIIQPNYLTVEGDRRVLLAGMKLARRLLASKPLQAYYEREDFPGPDVRTDDELLAAAKQRGTTTFHPMGTCRMGPRTDPTAVVDDQLRVHGLEGLRVIDASIMPTMLSANLNAATIMIGEKGSDLIFGRAAAGGGEFGGVELFPSWMDRASCVCGGLLVLGPWVPALAPLGRDDSLV